jgi:tRNA modification GTPase
MEEDTIVAVATPHGRSAIALVRVSGPNALSYARTLCVTSSLPPRCPVHTFLVAHDGDRVDDVLVTLFPGPRSYTGEDLVEFGLHGNPVLVREVVASLCALGARPARPGEFTLRAFLYGRMSLDQAEGVADLIASTTIRGARTALFQIDGAIADWLTPYREAVVSLLAEMTARVDFAEEGIPEIDLARLTAEIEKILAGLRRGLETADRGRILRDGMDIVLTGPPNAGKSTLFNALLGVSRSIVTDIPGTTRDLIKEQIEIGGTGFVVTDTAGITETIDLVESIGISRARDSLRQAYAAIVVLDGSKPICDAELALLSNASGTSKAVIIAVNKSDLPPSPDLPSDAEIARLFMGDDDDRLVWVTQTSGLRSDGIESLLSVLQQLGARALPSDDSVILMTERHIQLISEAAAILTQGLESLSAGLPLDIAALDVAGALRCISEVLGLEVGSDVLDRVFSRFCIGK